jgi:hypothetical protein
MNVKTDATACVVSGVSRTRVPRVVSGFSRTWVRLKADATIETNGRKLPNGRRQREADSARFSATPAVA